MYSESETPTGDKIAEMVANKIKTKYRVDEGSAYCKHYRASHEDCKGCESETGCRKMCEALALLFTLTLFPPQTFVEALKARETLKTELAKIMEEDV